VNGQESQVVKEGDTDPQKVAKSLQTRLTREGLFEEQEFKLTCEQSFGLTKPGIEGSNSFFIIYSLFSLLGNVLF
jgi:hypothetical protein